MPAGRTDTGVGDLEGRSWRRTTVEVAHLITVPQGFTVAVAGSVAPPSTPGKGRSSAPLDRRAILRPGQDPRALSQGATRGLRRDVVGLDVSGCRGTGRRGRWRR